MQEAACIQIDIIHQNSTLFDLFCVRYWFKYIDKMLNISTTINHNYTLRALIQTEQMNISILVPYGEIFSLRHRFKSYA